MNSDYQITQPLLFNPVKHHLGFIKDIIESCIERSGDAQVFLKHLGTSVMDIYTGSLTVDKICDETTDLLGHSNILEKKIYKKWVRENGNHRIITLSDGSLWTMKFHESSDRFIHLFPARNSLHTFRVKANTLKSAMFYIILIGKDLVTSEDLNKVRPILGLSPVKDTAETMAILETIDMLRE